MSNVVYLLWTKRVSFRVEQLEISGSRVSLKTSCLESGLNVSHLSPPYFLFLGLKTNQADIGRLLIQLFDFCQGITHVEEHGGTRISAPVKLLVRDAPWLIFCLGPCGNDLLAVFKASNAVGTNSKGQVFERLADLKWATPEAVSMWSGCWLVW